mmetsp:Transcript_60335/g.152775  ORF Transcript_60335/g.152775 Transcript_60335/m.152775 type:complete len:267 (-) Transcript_60335:46-846(-)
MEHRPPKVASFGSTASPKGTLNSMKRPEGVCKRIGFLPSLYSSTTVPRGSSRCERLQAPANCLANWRSLEGAFEASHGTGSPMCTDGQTACPCPTSAKAAPGSRCSGTSKISEPKAESSRALMLDSAKTAQREAVAPGGAGSLRPPLPEPGRPTRMAHQDTPLSISSAPSSSASFPAFLGSTRRGTQAVAAPGSCTTVQNCPPLAAVRTKSGTPRLNRSLVMGSGTASRQRAPCGCCGSGKASRASSTCVSQAEPEPLVGGGAMSA